MTSSPIELGAVYRYDGFEHPIRVIAFDNDLVMYDTWWPHEKAWGLAMLKRSISYYRLPWKRFASLATYLRTEEYTQAEFKIHRPDLPMAFGQYLNIQWHDKAPETIARASELLGVARASETAARPWSLDANEVVLLPFSPKGSVKPGTRLSSSNGNVFDEAELLWHAWRLQKPFLRESRVTDGVGLYRSGLERRIPSYYIWGSHSRLEQQRRPKAQNS